MKIVRKIGHYIKWSLISIRQEIVTARVKYQKKLNTINYNKQRSPKIIVSLTSYKKRFSTLDICIKSLLSQTMMPDRIILYLSKNEKIDEVPQKVKDLKKYGLEIRFVDLDLKPHKKYYYAMKEFPNDIVITVDDDIIYNKNLIKDLYTTYKRFPNCVIAARAHEITFDKYGRINKYKKWNMCSSKSYVPSFNFLATEGAGTLYPPHLLNLSLLLNLKHIYKYITVDDLWVKIVEILSNVPVVISNPILEKKRVEIPESQQFGLKFKNVEENQNDISLKQMEEEFSFTSILKKEEEDLKSNNA